MNTEPEVGCGWGMTRLEYSKEELDMAMRHVQLYGDRYPYDAMLHIWQEKLIPNTLENVPRLISIVQIAVEEVRNGCKTADEVFSRWSEKQEWIATKHPYLFKNEF